MFSRSAIACLLLGALLASLTGCTMPTPEEQVAANEQYLKQEGITALAVGDPLPDLSALRLEQQSGETVTFASLVAKHPAGVLIFLFPALETPNSQRNLLDWERRSSKLASQGLGVVAIAPGDLAAAQTWASSIGFRQPLLADPSGAAARALGCLSPTGSFPQRTTIGLTPDGKIALFWRGQADDKKVASAFGLTSRPEK
jgi:peroxiredoxin